MYFLTQDLTGLLCQMSVALNARELKLMQIRPEYLISILLLKQDHLVMPYLKVTPIKTMCAFQRLLTSVFLHLSILHFQAGKALLKVCLVF